MAQQTLNVICAYPFAWIAARNADATNAARVKRLIDAAYTLRSDWMGASDYHKQADQSYTRLATCFKLYDEVL